MNRFSGRGWFRFSLRTLLLVMAVACIWLGRQVNLVHQRRALLASLAADADARFDPRHTVFGPGRVAEFAELHIPGVSIPWYRKLLGDEVVSALGLPSDLERERVELVKAAFPEAIVTCEPPETHFVSQRAK